MDCQGFDLSTTEIHEWEVECIREAARTGNYLITPHAFQRMNERGIKADEIRLVLLNGNPVSKDLPGNPYYRKPGINLEGDLDDGRRIRVKVSWCRRYCVITAHEVAQ